MILSKRLRKLLEISGRMLSPNEMAEILGVSADAVSDVLADIDSFNFTWSPSEKRYVFANVYFWRVSDDN